MTNKNKDILLIIRHPSGGIRSFVKYVYTNDYFNKYDFTIILPKPYLNESLKDAWSSLNARYVTCDENVTALAFTAFIVLIRGDFRLIHSHGFTAALCSAVFARISNIPHLVTLHDMLLESQFAGLIGKLKQKMLPLFLNLSNCINCVSNDAKNNLLMMCSSICSNKVTVIPNGVDVSLIENAKARDFRAELNLHKNTYLIGFMGRFMSPKGFRYLVEAIDMLKKQNFVENQLVVITFGEGGFMRRDKRLVNDKGLSKYFYFLPSTDKPQEAIKGMDLVAMPSLWEVSGLVAMEVLCAGIPLIASNCIGLRETISGSPAIITKPADAASLAEAIKEASLSDNLYKFQSYKPFAQSRYNVIRTSLELCKLYDNLTS